ncbi:MAG: hypothetical protein IT425_14410 [Pirellulales bacterium]|nr:hypothetical protein [Pirellulales bacterium]
MMGRCGLHWPRGVVWDSRLWGNCEIGSRSGLGCPCKTPRGKGLSRRITTKHKATLATTDEKPNAEIGGKE